jgi:hypothetical protein
MRSSDGDTTTIRSRAARRDKIVSNEVTNGCLIPAPTNENIETSVSIGSLVLAVEQMQKGVCNPQLELKSKRRVITQIELLVQPGVSSGRITPAWMEQGMVSKLMTIRGEFAPGRGVLHRITGDFQVEAPE